MLLVPGLKNNRRLKQETETVRKHKIIYRSIKIRPVLLNVRSHGNTQKRSELYILGSDKTN